MMAIFLCKRCKAQYSNSVRWKLSVSNVLLIFKYILFLTVIVYIFWPYRYACGSYTYILVENVNETVFIHNTEHKTNLCPFLEPSKLLKFVNIEVFINNDTIEKRLRGLHIRSGGSWTPSNCRPRFNVAILVPYRDRQLHLNPFLYHMHLFLQQQFLNYTIYLIEQSSSKEFNRGKLFNVGFTLAQKESNYCFVFHDIDLLPEVLGNFYACTELPRHMSSSVNTFRYNLLYSGLFGGVVSMTAEQFIQVNGFSNKFYGWGGEDDDMWKRLELNGLSVIRLDPHLARYYMLSHPKELPSERRFLNLKDVQLNSTSSGLSNTEFTIKHSELKDYYTWYLVDV